MVFANLRRDERIGLGIALGLHLALVGVLLIRPAPKTVFEPAERMTVNLATDVSLEATAPDPVPESRAAVAPALSPEPAPEPVAEPEPQPIVEPRPEPQPRVQPRPEPPRPVATTPPRPKPPRPVATTPPRPKPAPRVTPQPRTLPEAASTEPRRRPDTPSTRAQSTPTPPRRSGGSRIGADFLPGSGDSSATTETRTPASQIGASAKASLFQAVARQLKPHWQPPSGPEVEEIVTKVRFRLNPNGSLSGRPEMVGQRGITDLNRAQAGRHAEQSVRAVQLAAPFNLPSEYYEAWKVITVDFDWKLSQ